MPPELDVSFDARNFIMASRWLKNGEWRFGDYASLLSVYTSREITYESDRLNAITGCLSIITEATGVGFATGLPLKDFHTPCSGRVITIVQGLVFQAGLGSVGIVSTNTTIFIP